MNTINVLIIEDDPMVAEVNSKFVNSVPGFQVCGTAGTAREGIEMATSINPDLALIDVFLPDQDGISLLQELRRLMINTDAILVTAAHDAETIQGAFRYGAVDFIVKPFKLKRLQMALESYSTMRQKLNSLISLNQTDIDRLKAGHYSDTASDNEIEDVPKGLNSITMKQVLLYMIKSPQAMSAEEVAEGLGLARVTARRYLEYLDEIGRVTVDQQYGSVGRPLKRYSIR
ncbi:MAG: chemotaxis protein CheY [Peptococcaceae bacterium BICA1-7]|nr:MAG: chemotaxis protein CheY [Peptococcaceae bacterium BICA1-7]HBV96967.1 two-component system response regulator [Desulfotomaculum sp.]